MHAQCDLCCLYCIRLSGTVDHDVGGMAYLVDIDLHNNKLTGTIPDSLWYMARLDHLDWSSNELTGTLSPAVR